MPFAILRDFLGTGNADDYDLWIVWEKTSHIRRQVTWSRALREWAGLHRERSDGEVAAEDKRGEDAFVLPLRPGRRSGTGTSLTSGRDRDRRDSSGGAMAEVPGPGLRPSGP